MSVPVPPSAIDRYPADTMRCAAERIRRCVAHEDDWAHLEDFHLAVADWLDACALVVLAAPDATKAHALRVARAYLGDAA